MEIESKKNEENGRLFTLEWGYKVVFQRSFSKVAEIARQTRKVGEDDPRRVIHSLKVGLALTLVSLFYYFQPLYHSFGVSAMWAVMTVVVVFEFSVGATIGKGLNRGLATLVACALGLGAQQLASKTGKIGEPIVIGVFVFLQAVASTFLRFFPNVKARYDYGLLIFILTFCLVSISGFRTDEILDLAQKRLSTIFIGASACIMVSILVYPVWAGEDLHNLVANNIEKLGNFLEGFGDEYFKESFNSERMNNNKSCLAEYKSVLNSKNTEETLANFARWEPGHGEFLYRHPWKQYLKIGTLIRQCAFRIEALNGYLNSEIKATQEINETIKMPCINMSKECGEAMKKLALSIKTMTRPTISTPNPHILTAKNAALELKSLLKSNILEDIKLLQVIPVAAVASLLTDIVTFVEEIAESINELASLAQFKALDIINVPKEKGDISAAAKQIIAEKDCSSHVIISINGTSSAILDSDDHQNTP
ncbi:hypothetical protein M9H77_16854 [Catharanthus roseus]|uniref:Uncharacterized protein n=1 Tax=Catharanthus roseus TaxID=4058 RepID=A0ACC0B2Y8_CATRO|nr:hypothetical protein M9H77_16854 [Catharanthus roseus]